MSSAYVAEIQTSTGKKYLKTGGKLSQLPHFWRSAPVLKDALARKMGVLSDADLRIIRVQNLYKGLQNAKATVLSLGEFFAQNPVKMPPAPKNAQYKIQCFPKSPSPKFIGKGRFGKTWDSAADVRRHISLNLSQNSVAYREAEVLEILYDEKTMKQLEVRRIPLIQFYCQSADCAKRFHELY